MHKTILFSILFLGLLSCTKEYECVCVQNWYNVNGDVVQTANTSRVIEAKKKDLAQSECTKNNFIESQVKLTCNLK